MDDLLNIISTVGFPIAITIYLLIRFDGMLKSMIISQEKMISTIDKLCNKIDLLR